MDLTMWQKLAAGEHPYDGGPFSADHIKVFRDDARKVLAELTAARARVAALEAELAKVKGHRAELAERRYRKDLELDELRSTAWADD